MNILFLISILLFFGINISNGIRNYIFVPKPLPFTSAIGYCKGNYGTGLATIKSPIDNARANQKCPGTCYIGINDRYGEGQFKNLDGSPASYTNWGPGEPNNWRNEDCVEITPNGRWNDIGCNTPKPFLCDAAPGQGGNTPTFRPTPKPTIKPTDKPTKRPISVGSIPVPGGPVRDYVYVSIPMTFDGANAYCRNVVKTRLATIKTPMDNARADKVCTSKCYIGINDRSSEGYFRNLDGSRAIYTNWSPGEPNNVGNEDCVEIYAGGRWNDIPCYSKKAFICDKPGPVGPRNYVFIPAPKTFNEARLYCQYQVRTSLAIISNPADNARAASQCRSQCFIGMNDQTAERQWKNIDGSPATYFNWNWGEPNNWGNEDCVEILPNGKMNDLSCNTKRPFLCIAPGSAAHQGNDIETNDIETNDIFNDNNIKNVNPVEKTGVMVYLIGLLSGVVLVMIMAIVYVACKGIISNPRHKTYQYKSVTPKFTSDEDTSDVQSDA